MKISPSETARGSVHELAADGIRRQALESCTGVQHEHISVFMIRTQTARRIGVTKSQIHQDHQPDCGYESD